MMGLLAYLRTPCWQREAWVWAAGGGSRRGMCEPTTGTDQSTAPPAHPVAGLPADCGSFLCHSNTPCNTTDGQQHRWTTTSGEYEYAQYDRWTIRRM